MENTKNWLDDLKLCFSYGTAGNNNIPSGQISQLYELNKTPWINGVNSYIAPSKYMANSEDVYKRQQYVSITNILKN